MVAMMKYETVESPRDWPHKSQKALAPKTFFRLRPWLGRVRPSQTQSYQLMRVFIRAIRAIRDPIPEVCSEFPGFPPARPQLIRVKASQTQSNQFRPNSAEKNPFRSTYMQPRKAFGVANLEL
jgi:hypothetical protein